MSTYRQADPDVKPLIAEVMAVHHVHLAEAGVTIAALFAFADVNEATGEPKGPALKHHGWPALAVVKINSQKDRAEGKDDATITIDGKWWEGATDAEKFILLDHEIEHLEVRLEDEDNTASIMTDDSNRPKLKMRPHDFELGGFDSIIERHGRNALEMQNLTAITKRPAVQKTFQW